MCADSLEDSVDLSDFDFQELEDSKDKIRGICSDCGISVHENRGCWCSGRRVTYHNEPHRVWAPFNNGTNENPEPRAEFIFSTSPDYDRYKQLIEEAFAAKPVLQDFVKDFDWDNDSTQDYRSMIDAMLEVPQIQVFLRNLDQARNPVKNFCNKTPTITPSNAQRYTPENVIAGQKKHPPTDLAWLTSKWFEKASKEFRRYVKVLFRDSVYKQLKIYTKNLNAYEVLTNGFKISDSISYELVPTWEQANLYVFGPEDFQQSIAAQTKNVFGLCFNGPVGSCSYPFDVSVQSHGFVNIRVPFTLDSKDGEAPTPFFHEVDMITYRGLHYLIPQGKFSYVPSGHFDTPWISSYWDPARKMSVKVRKCSQFSSCVGLVLSYYAVKQSAVTVPIGNLVQCSVADGINHPLLTPRVRTPIHFAGFPLADWSFSDEFIVRCHQGDVVCHWSLYVGKNFCDLIIRSERHSIRRSLSGDFGRSESFHGFGILDWEGVLTNPVCYHNPRSPGSSLITLLDARLFTLFNTIGGWAVRSNVSWMDIKETWELLRRTDFWIISALRPSNFLCDNANWYSPICYLDLWAHGEAKSFTCPPVGSSAFELFAQSVDLFSLASYSLNWTSEGNLGKRSF